MCTAYMSIVACHIICILKCAHLRKCPLKYDYNMRRKERRIEHPRRFHDGIHEIKQRHLESRICLGLHDINTIIMFDTEIGLFTQAYINNS